MLCKRTKNPSAKPLTLLKPHSSGAPATSQRPSVYHPSSLSRTKQTLSREHSESSPMPESARRNLNRLRNSLRRRYSVIRLSGYMRPQNPLKALTAKNWPLTGQYSKVSTKRSFKLRLSSATNCKMLGKVAPRNAQQCWTRSARPLPKPNLICHRAKEACLTLTCEMISVSRESAPRRSKTTIVSAMKTANDEAWTSEKTKTLKHCCKSAIFWQAWMPLRSHGNLSSTRTGDQYAK